MVKRTILARFTLFFLRNPYPELALLGKGKAKLRRLKE